MWKCWLRWSARLLEDAPVEDQEEAMKKDPTIGAIISGMNRNKQSLPA